MELSVITPVYNCRNFIEGCLANVAGQVFDGLEHVIVDGASTDGTAEIVRDFAADHAHVRWVSERDNGQSDAMNKGLAMARSEVVGFLNADDFYEPCILAEIPELLAEAPCPTLLVGNCNVWDDDGSLAEVNRPSRLEITDLMLGWTINPYPINAAQYFYHKSLHDAIGLYDTNEHYTLDIDFLSRAVQVAHVKHIDRIFGNYRKISGTKTVEDINSGCCARRFYEVLEKHRKMLPAGQRARVAVKRVLWRSSRRNGWARFRA